MPLKVESGSEYEGFYNRFQHETALEERRQAERARSAENKLLGQEDISMDEYKRRREAQRFLLVEPDLPLDEMTHADYCKMRQRQLEAVEVAPLRMGEMSYSDYGKARRRENGS